MSDEPPTRRIALAVRRRLTEAEREQLAATAHRRYLSGESWAQIASDVDLHPGHVRRLTMARHPVEYRRRGQKASADEAEVVRRRGQGESIQTIATALSCSRTAVRTALEQVDGLPRTRYPRLSDRREPTEVEIRDLLALYEACPPAPRARPGHRDTGNEHGRELAISCRDLVEAGVPMQTLSRALGRGPTWVHWLLSRHDLRPSQRDGRSTSRRTRDDGAQVAGDQQ